MKIVIVGNTNNYPLRLCLALRALDVDAHIVINQEQLLHRPEGLNHEYRDNYPPWMHDYSHLQEADFVGPTTRIVQLINLLENSEGTILNHYGPSLLPYYDVPSISFLTGSDLEYYANFDSIVAMRKEWGKDFKRSAAARLDQALWVNFIERQRAGIQKSRAVSFLFKGVSPLADRLLEEIGVSDDRRFTIYMADVPEHNVYTANRDKVRVFNGARLTWMNPMPAGSSVLDNKRTDILIKGLGLFFRNTGIELDIHLVEKGWHIEETRDLAREEGIYDQITWLPELTQYEFRKKLEDCDIFTDQLGPGFMGMAAMDAMAAEKPVIVNSRPEIFVAAGMPPPPVCHAENPKMVCKHLGNLVDKESVRHRTGKESRRYIIKHMSPRIYAKKCLDILGL